MHNLDRPAASRVDERGVSRLRVLVLDVPAAFEPAAQPAHVAAVDQLDPRRTRGGLLGHDGLTSDATWSCGGASTTGGPRGCRSVRRATRSRPPAGDRP